MLTNKYGRHGKINNNFAIITITIQVRNLSVVKTSECKFKR